MGRLTEGPSSLLHITLRCYQGSRDPGNSVVADLNHRGIIREISGILHPGECIPDMVIEKTGGVLNLLLFLAA